MQKLLVALLLSQSLAMALSLDCFHCSYNDFASSNSVLNFFLTTMSKLSNSHCREPVGNSALELNVRRCPPARPGHVYKCGVINGRVEASILGGVLDVHYNTIERDCIEVPTNDDSYTDGCHNDLPSNSVVRKLVDQTFEGTDLGDVTFSGEACFHSDGINALTCPRCTDTEVLTDNRVLQFFIDAVQTISDRSCLMENPSEDQYEVNYHICPAAGSGQIAKCGSIAGTISGRFDAFSLDFEVNTQHRKCVTVPVSDSTYSDGCHSDMNVNNPVMAPLVSESLAGTTGISGENFNGQACFERYFSVAGGANSVTVHSVTALVSLVTAIVAVIHY